MSGMASEGPRPRVFLGICGGIAAFKSPELVRRFGERGFEVRCALTRSGKAFIAPLTLEVLTRHAVYEQEYLTPTGRGEESHIQVAQWADVLLIAPATAHMLARLALGLADDFLSTTALAFEGPLVVAPAMHTQMWGKEAVREHVATLHRRGVQLVGPVEGPLASGEWGFGRMAAPEEITAAVERALGRGELAGRRVLVTAGPTWEPIDPVRFLGNRSSGKMGFALAAEAARRGAHATLVAGPVALATPPGVDRIDVTTALEMRDAMVRCAPQADLIIMAAAVADFRPVTTSAGKIKKERGIPELELEVNPDILLDLAEVAPDALRVGFAAETEASEAEARAKLERKGAEFLVWNNVSDLGVGFGSDDNEVTVYRRSGEPVFLSRRPKRELAVDLVDLFSQALKERERTPASPSE